MNDCHALEFNNVSKIYETGGGGRLAALEDVSFAVETGRLQSQRGHQHPQTETPPDVPQHDIRIVLNIVLILLPYPWIDYECRECHRQAETRNSLTHDRAHMPTSLPFLAPLLD